MQGERLSYVYILGNWTGSVLYIGVTTDLKRRVWEHTSKVYRGFTGKYNVNQLLYYEMFEDVRDAIYREKKLKDFSRDNKNALISEFNPGWIDLYRRI